MSLALVINSGQVERVGATLADERLEVRGGAEAGIDLSAAGLLGIAAGVTTPAVATSVEIGTGTAIGIPVTIGKGGAGGSLTTIAGDLTVSGNEIVTGTTTFTGTSTFEGDVIIGAPVGTATTDQLTIRSSVQNSDASQVPVSNTSILFESAVDHVLVVDTAADETAGDSITQQGAAGGATAGAAAGGAGGASVNQGGIGGAGDATFAAGAGGDARLLAGNAGADGGGGGGGGGNVAIEAGTATDGGTPSITIAGTNPADVEMGSGTNGLTATIFSTETAGAGGLFYGQPLALDTETGTVQQVGIYIVDGSASTAAISAQSGSLALDDTGAVWVNTSGGGVGTTWSMLASGAGNSLQQAYDAGATISVDTNPVGLSNSTDSTDVLTIDRTFVGAGNALTITMGEPGDEAVTGNGISITSGTGATGAMLFVNNQGTNNALQVQDGGTDVLVVTSAGKVTSGVDGGGTTVTNTVVNLGGNLELRAIDDSNVTVEAGDSGAVTITQSATGVTTGGGFTVDVNDAAAAGATAGDISIWTAATAGTLGGVVIGSGDIAAVAPVIATVQVIAQPSSGPNTLLLGATTTSLTAVADVAGPKAADVVIASSQDGGGAGNAGALTVHSTVTSTGTGNAGAATFGSDQAGTGASGNAGTVIVQSTVSGQTTGTGSPGNVEIRSSIPNQTTGTGTSGDILIWTGVAGLGSVGGIKVYTEPGANGTPTDGILLQTGVGGGGIDTIAADEIRLHSADLLTLDGDGLVDIDAGANLDIDVTGTVDVLASSTFSIDGTGASNVSATSGNLTISTITSGDVIIDGADAAAAVGGGVTITAGDGGGANAGGVVALAGGAGGTTDGDGGNVTVTGGAGGVTNSDGGDVTIAGGAGAGTGVQGTITFDALDSTSPIPFNETGDVDLDAGFTATSVIGALNELFGGVGQDNATFQGTTAESVATGAPLAFNTTNGVVEANADSTASPATRQDAIGLALVGVGSAATVTILTAGEMTVPDAQWDTPPGAGDSGKVVFVDDVVGQLTLTAPVGGGDRVLKIGLVTFADGTAGTTKVAIPVPDSIKL